MLPCEHSHGCACLRQAELFLPAQRAGLPSSSLVTAADETTLHYAMDTPDDLVLICAGSAIGALSMVMPGFGSSKTAGRSPAIQIAAPGQTSPIQTLC